jgi:hypothetical protein
MLVSAYGSRMEPMTRDAWLMTITSVWFAVAVSLLLYMASAGY